MDVLEAVRTKHAVRRFRDEPVPDDVMRKILDAGRRSQSSKNTQPWQFVVIRDRERLKALAQTGNFTDHMLLAAFAVVLVGERNTEPINFDLGQAAAYMQLAAWGLGVGSCLFTMHRPDDAKQVLGIPPEQYVYTGLSFGYPVPNLPRNQGGRKKLDEVVRWETW
jgi:nitroreductase